MSKDEDETVKDVLDSKNDAQEVKEILEAVSATVPKLLNEITEALFSAEKSEAFGMAVAKFYKSMVDAGMNEERAFELTEKFMDSSSPGGMISKVLGDSGGINIGGHGHHGHRGSHDKDGDEIEKKIKEKIARKFEDE
ncbi:MAG: hypothetical protein KKH41_08680 [Candidatus Thermoplasmatota archaeon]|nr:hypothetical protein [Euryarchaeota archaeon]MBU4031454.1 hypothetical protein [Candidatus Thermoplasmatota archaeon]MBU4071893.1 hypothetical protein [Candidatus Thermoplasmatota archaeon]MBU4143449.1 hypothetical protein [Candidatus Thermoplasmatota archaeon]MBU4592639.1 hypothetical protein [Candidatus Thermoplasmatota archaeon]